MKDLDKTIKQYLAKIGAKGGKSTSEAKKRAARLNGKKGGRAQSFTLDK